MGPFGFPFTERSLRTLKKPETWVSRFGLYGVSVDQAATKAASSGFSSVGASVLISRSTATPVARLRDHLLSVSSETPLSAHVSLTRTVDRKSTRLNSSHRCISYAVF